MDHWPLHARTWSRLGPPLRPSPEDVRVIESEIAGFGRPVDLLVLGVTPELVGMSLPPGSRVVAVDRDPAMIEALFAPGPGRQVLVGEWRALPFPEASIDVVAGDGCASFFAFPDEYRIFAAELARVVRKGGHVLLRLFASPDIRESIDDVRRAMSTIRGFDALKWRIAMAIQSPARAVAVRAIRDAFESLVPDRDALAAQSGWAREAIDLIDNYRDSDAVYSFPTLDEARACFEPWFEETACHTGSYELGDRCPTLVLRRS